MLPHRQTLSSQTINNVNYAENYTKNGWIRLTELMKFDSIEFNDFVIIDDAVTMCDQSDEEDIIAENQSFW